MEESGWKLVHGDVFRPPRFHMLLSALLGTGVQLFGLTTLIIGMFYIYIYIILHCLLPSAHYPLLKLTLSLWSSQMEGRGHAIETVLNMLYHISSLSFVQSLLGSIPEYLCIII